MRVRKDVWKLPAGDDTLDWYGKAITAMSELPITDPRSWHYQAAIHGIDPPPPPALRPYWAQCQHRTSFFLSWHRMYILRFERIVAAQIEALGGPKNWALPYWDYSRNPEYRALPVAFRHATLPGGAPNPLYTSQRNPGANAGTATLDAKDVDVKICLKAPGTTAPAGFFGGEPSAHFGSLSGALEQTPHNTVHRWVGLGDGLMANPNLAALDPIFWVHHSNIDRLWEVWLGRDPTHKNLSTAYWLTGVSFKFHDENDKVITMRSADVLNLSAPALDYSYQDTSDPLAAAPRAMAVGAPAKGGPTGPTMTTPHLDLVGATMAPIQLGDQVLHVRLPTPVTPQDFKAAASPGARVAQEPASALVQQVILQLENVTSTAIAPTYDVYVNVPDAMDPSAHEDRFVGRVAMFGIAEASDPSGQHGGAGQSFAFDITDLYHRLSDAGEVDPNDLRVSFVPVEPEGDPKVSVGRIGIYFA